MEQAKIQSSQKPEIFSLLSQDQEQMPDDQCTHICHQFYLIGPEDVSCYRSVKQDLGRLAGQNFPQEKVINFITKNIKIFGYSNARLLYRIKTQFFWGGVIGFMIISVLKDNHRLSATLNTLHSLRSSIIEINKYDAFLLLSNMFLGILPSQIYLRDSSFGKLMSVMDDEDEISATKKLNLRLNKLKAIVKYFCVAYKRYSEQDLKKGQEESKRLEIYPRDFKLIFQRTKCSLNMSEILDDNIFLIPVQFGLGKYYDDNNEINSISILQSVSSMPGELTYGDKLDLEQKMFFSHPEFFILKLLMSDPLEKKQSIIIYGAQKYSTLNAVSKDSIFDFSQKYKDTSEFNIRNSFFNTTFIWVNKGNYPSHSAYDILPDVQKVIGGIRGCKSYFDHTQQTLVSGSYKNPGVKSLKAPSDIKFLTEWIAASVQKWQNMRYLVEDEKKMKNFEILCKELSLHTIRDLLGIISEFYEFRLNSKASISLLEYIKRFVL